MFSFVSSHQLQRQVQRCANMPCRGLLCRCNVHRGLCHLFPHQPRVAGKEQIIFVSGELWLVLCTSQHEEHWEPTHSQPILWQRNCMHPNFCKLLVGLECMHWGLQQASCRCLHTLPPASAAIPQRSCSLVYDAGRDLVFLLAVQVSDCAATSSCEL